MSAGSLSEADAAALEECIASGGVAVIPTDTVYGLACDPSNADAVERLYALKGRPPRKPSAVLFFGVEQAMRHLGDLPPQTAQAARRLLPGPVTLLLPNSAGLFGLACDPGGEADGGQPPLGVRVPDWPQATAALAAVEVPAMQSSANLSGGSDPRSLTEVPASIRDAADLLLDGGPLGSVPSTVVDLTSYERDGSWRVLREGALASDAVRRALAMTSPR